MSLQLPPCILKPAIDAGKLTFIAPAWPNFQLGPGQCQLQLNGQKYVAVAEVLPASTPECHQLIWKIPEIQVHLQQTITQETPHRLRIHTRLVNTSSNEYTLGEVELWSIDGIPEAQFSLGQELAQVRILENQAYRGQVRSCGQIFTGSDQRRGLDRNQASFYSEAVTICYNHQDRQGVLMGFESFARFNGRIRASAHQVQVELNTVFENVDRGTFGPKRVFTPAPEFPENARFTEAGIGFYGAQIPVAPGQEIGFEDWVLELGTDPFLMLETYADRVAERHQIHDLPEAFANWCSWYPYRLGVSEERVLEIARTARQRFLDKLGLRFIQVDLGWERDNIPTYFEVNPRFAHGFKWLAAGLHQLGFQLGVWQGFTCISEQHAIAREHPDWLVHDEKGELKVSGTWFWEPHDRMYILDVTHPEAREWVVRNLTALAASGVRYLKWDFGGNILHDGRRWNPQIACSRALEGMRQMGKDVQAAMNSQGAKGLVLDCTTGETANLGNFALFYTTYDTGNSGLGFHHLRHVYTTVAAHLFKNHRWALLQPSCLVVGLPGNIGEARIRATASFMTGGHIDISDDLPRLPEDRWQVLLKTLPPLNQAARVIDLFYPVRITTGSYAALAKGEMTHGLTTTEPQGAVIWQTRLQTDWDQWQLVAVLHLFEPEAETSGAQVPIRFQIPFEALGLVAAQHYWAHEFWSGQFLGEIPIAAWPMGSYRHPGDTSALINDSAPDLLDLTFQGPAVKLLILRQPRPHPWPVGTTFHQSGGLELTTVKWSPAKGELTGKLNRPPGEIGEIFVAGLAHDQRVQGLVNGKEVMVRRAANGVIVLPILTSDWVTEWRIKV